jgi:hypothetical protein
VGGAERGLPERVSVSAEGVGMPKRSPASRPYQPTPRGARELSQPFQAGPPPRRSSRGDNRAGGARGDPGAPPRWNG